MLTHRNILVVEDNTLNRQMLVEILSDNYTALEAENGLVALDVLKQYGDNIALILLDVMMPVMDGYTFLEVIKQDPMFSMIPVIIMTQSSSEADEIAALSHGATDFVPKPYRPQVILHRIASIIRLRENAAMINQFQHDRLTGLFSRDFFFQKAQEVLAHNPDKEYNIVCSNIINFKLYNDTFGISSGDRLLKDFAAILKEKLGERGVCGRYSADRFVCLQERSLENAHRAVFEVSQTDTPVGVIKNFEVKWGVYEIADRSLPMEYMCDRAMLAADSIKGQYNRIVAVYDDTLRKRLLREQSITSCMEAALEKKQFTVFLQPKYRASDSKLCGAEALVRWIHPELGFMPPGEFIPLFEKNGFITRLDQFVWDRTCELLREWKDKGYAPLPISVNVSRADIYQPDLADYLLRLAEKHGINPRLLHLEITESAYTENSKQIINTVDQLRARGFFVEMDDFGSGYSSLNMLSQLKLDILKLDMKFVQSEMQQDSERSILRLIVEMAHRMNLSVVAEGVETQEQLHRLQEISCDYVQGYLFSKPVPHTEYEALLRSFTLQLDTAQSAAPILTGSKQYLLIADEDSHSRKLLEKAFPEQYEVVAVSDCGQALAFLSDHAQDLGALILSSTLPAPGASAVVRNLRRITAPRRIPVMVMTAPQLEPEVRELGLDVDDIAFKPGDLPCLHCLNRRLEWINTVAAYRAREHSELLEACQDYLTGLLNRRGFQIALDSFQKEDLPMTLFLFDLDNLKEINDTHGHAAGDQILKHFADVLRRNTRSGDTLCRYGADEFALILRGMRSVDAVLRKGENICRGMMQFELPNGQYGTCSGGVVICTDETISPAALVEQAEKALYHAKQTKRGSCVLWNREI